MKCIIEKLATSINDASLYKFEELRLYSYVGIGASTPQQGKLYIEPTSGQSVKVSAITGKIYNDSARQEEITGEITITMGKTFYYTQVDDSFSLSIIGKSKLKQISASSVAMPTNQLQYTTAEIRAISFVEGSLNEISNLNVPNNPVQICVDKQLAGELESDGKAKIILYPDVEFAQPLSDYSFLVGENDIRAIRLYFRDEPSLASLLGNNPNLRNFHYNGLNNVWESTTLRDVNYTPLCGSFRFKRISDTDNFLINMAACQGTDYYVNKNIRLTGAGRSSASDAAVASLTARGFTIS